MRQADSACSRMLPREMYAGHSHRKLESPYVCLDDDGKRAIPPLNLRKSELGDFSTTLDCTWRRWGSSPVCPQCNPFEEHAFYWARLQTKAPWAPRTHLQCWLNFRPKAPTNAQASPTQNAKHACNVLPQFLCRDVGLLMEAASKENDDLN